MLQLEDCMVLGLYGAEGSAFRTGTDVGWDPLPGSLEVVHSSR